MEQLFREAFPRPSPLRLIQVESSQYLREYDLDWGRQEEAGVSGIEQKNKSKTCWMRGLKAIWRVPGETFRNVF